MLNDPAGDDKPTPRAPFWRRLPYREVLLFLAIVLGVQLWQTRDMASGVMPPLAGTLADGRRASLEATLAAASGRPALVYIWSAWCPICKAQQGTIASIAADWPVLTLAMQSGGVADVAQLMKARGIGYPALVDERGEMAWQLGVRGVPAYFVVDAQRRIRFAGSGYTTGWGLRLRLWWASVAA